MEVSINDTRSELLEQEKTKDYKTLVILQGLIILTGFLLKEFMVIAGLSGKVLVLRDVLFMGLNSIYIYFGWDILKTFRLNKRITTTIFIILVMTYLVLMVTVIPYIKLVPDQAVNKTILSSSVLFFTLQLIVLYYAAKDIFAGKNFSAEKLWGAASLYIMTGLLFANLYDIICLSQPGSMGVYITPGIQSHLESLYYSISVISGIDPGYPDASMAIKKVAVVEALWSNLFIVLMVGRLLGLPQQFFNKEEN